LKIEQYELPEEAAGLSVVLTVRYICEKQIIKQNKHFILITKILPQFQPKKNSQEISMKIYNKLL